MVTAVNFQNSTLSQQESVSFHPLTLNFSRIPNCFNKENTAEMISHDFQGWITKGDTLPPGLSYLPLTTLTPENSHHAIKKPKPAYIER